MCSASSTTMTPAGCSASHQRVGDLPGSGAPPGGALAAVHENRASFADAAVLAGDVPRARARNGARWCSHML